MARIVGRQNRKQKQVVSEYYECAHCGAVGTSRDCACGKKAVYCVSINVQESKKNGK
ncbi:MAG: hypothetical protein GY934_09765 [Gammaproteobacteria bacterium]|nr:hypothetical protein [Gammaproteobacteria bacterium]